MRVDQPTACCMTSACARRSHSRSTGRRSSRRCSTTSPTWATTRRSRRSILDEQGAAAPSGHPPGQAADRRPPAEERLEDGSRHLQTAELPQLAQIVKQAVSRSAAHQRQDPDGHPVLLGSPTQTPWLNNPMTITDWATAACRTCCSTRRSRARQCRARRPAPGTRPTSRTRSTIARQVVRRRRRARRPAEDLQADRAPAARSDAGDLPYF